MDLSLTLQQRELTESARHYGRWLAEGAAAREAAHGIEPEVIRGLAERGLCAVNVPRRFGGSEAGAVAYALCLREIAAGDAAVAVTMAVTNLASEVIARFGSDEQKARYLGKLASGEYFGGAFALSEPGAGSDAASLRTRAVRHGRDWVLNGEKLWISTGDQAGVIVVWARSNEAPGSHGLSCFLVEQGTEGLRPGKPEEKMGLRASHTVPLALQDVRVSEAALLGPEGNGFTVAMAALDGGRIGIGSQSLGLGSRALEEARRHALERRQFGKPLGEMAAIQHQLADSAVDLDAAWLLTLRAAWLKETAQPFSCEAAMAKVFSSEAANRVVRRAVHILGGRGYMEDSITARLVRDCRVTQIYEGTSEIQRLVIARAVLAKD